MDAVLNFDYDRGFDYLYARFGESVPDVNLDLAGTPILIVLRRDDRKMQGFDITLFRELAPHRVPMLTGPVPTPLEVPANTPWLTLEYGDDDLRMFLEDAPDEAIKIPSFAAQASRPDGVAVDLTPLFAGHRTEHLPG